MVSPGNGIGLQIVLPDPLEDRCAAYLAVVANLTCGECLLYGHEFTPLTLFALFSLCSLYSTLGLDGVKVG